MQFSLLEAGSGSPLIFLHGIGGNAATWRDQLNMFANEYHVVAVDLPGYGNSDPLAKMTFPALAGWLHQLLTQFKFHAPILIGHSFGGMIVQEYLATYDDAVTAVAFYGTSPAFGRKGGDWQQTFIRNRLQPLDDGSTMVELAPAIARGLVGTDASSAGIERVRAGVAAVAEETFRAAVICLTDFDQRANLGNIDIPCLLIVGEEDNNAPPSMMARMADRIPKARFCQLPGLGHMAHLENPALFNTALQSFLANDSQ